MIIQELKMVDPLLLKEMLFMAIHIPPGQPPVSREILELPSLRVYYEKWGSEPHDVAIAALKKETLLGLVWGRAHQKPNQGFGYISEDIPEISIAVKPGQRNQGLGSALIEAISKHYIRLGVHAISLSVDKRNPAKNLYQRQGFLVVEENQDDFIMKKNLFHK